jgi:hypothetical protein
MSRNRFAVKTIIRLIATSLLDAEPVGDDYFLATTVAAACQLGVNNSRILFRACS